jgi:uncharacterized membrane protein
MSDLIVITYDHEQLGRDAFNELANMQKMQILELEDAALALKDKGGKVKITQTLENQATGSAAIWGGFWGLLIGLLFLAPIFWGLMGALLGYIMGKSSDIGIDDKFIKQVSDSLEPGGAALFLLVIKATPDKVLEQMQQFGGEVYQTSLSNEDEEKLKKALEHPNVKDAAEDSLDLEEAKAA